MTLKTPAEQAASDLAKLYDTDLPGVVSATYTAPGSEDGTDCTVRMRYGSGPEGEGADDLAPAAVLLVRVSEIAILEIAGAFSDGTDTWEVLAGDKTPNGLEWIAAVNRR